MKITRNYLRRLIREQLTDPSTATSASSTRGGGLARAAAMVRKITQADVDKARDARISDLNWVVSQLEDPVWSKLSKEERDNMVAVVEEWPDRFKQLTQALEHVED